MAKQVGGEVVAAFLREHRNLPSRSAARMLTELHPGLFKDIETARARVRYYRCAQGKRNAIRAAGNGLARPHGSQRDAVWDLPEPIGEAHTWREIPVECRRALVISDIHIPFHDRAALDLALKEGKRRAVDCVILNGDVVDFHSVSFWERDPRLRDLSAELEATEYFLESLRDRFPKARIVYKDGNHEERLPRWVWTHVPEFAGLAGLQLKNLLHLDDYGIEHVGDKQPLRVGPHLRILHGHEFRAPFLNPVNPARGLYLRCKCNALCGDLHQTSQHTESGLTHTVSTWSVGALCDLRPKYMPLNKWNAGFAVVEVRGDAWSVENLKIIGGQVV